MGIELSTKARKIALIFHIIFSVGWFGAVAVYFSLGISSYLTSDVQHARSAFLAMKLSTLHVIVPFCILSLFTGIIQSLGTRWGLLKHYWIVFKLMATVGMTFLLLLHLKPIAELAARPNVDHISSQESAELWILLKNSGAALLTLIILIIISVLKPWGKVNVSRGFKGIFLTNNRQMLYLLLGITLVALLLVIMRHLRN